MSKQCPPSIRHPESRKLWRDIQSHYDLESFHLKLLQCACECFDRIVDCRKILDSEGLVVTDTYKRSKEHPAAGLELKNKALLARLFRELALDVDVEESRPKPRY